MLSGLDLPMLALLAAAGVALDLALGEARRWHPLVGFGRLAAGIESVLNKRILGRGIPGRFGAGRAAGVLAWMVAVLPPVLLCWWLAGFTGDVGSDPARGMLHAVLLYFCLGLRSLRDHALPIESALRRGDLDAARAATARIVSRDTDRAAAPDLAKAGVESMLENGNDAVFGTLFWFAVAGGPGALLFRLCNTLDAMWGYRTPRFHAFGWAAARVDDLLNWVPARLTAVSYALLGNTRLALRCWRTQAPLWSSPNAGPVMASGAGALGIALGGAASYGGVTEDRPVLGSGRPAEAGDIRRAWRLVAGATAGWIACLALVVAANWAFERMMHA